MWLHLSIAGLATEAAKSIPLAIAATLAANVRFNCKPLGSGRDSATQLPMWTSVPRRDHRRRA
jgi:hypothetical protein